jgi:hypothetical protein
LRLVEIEVIDASVGIGGAYVLLRTGWVNPDRRGRHRRTDEFRKSRAWPSCLLGLPNWGGRCPGRRPICL